MSLRRCRFDDTLLGGYHGGYFDGDLLGGCRGELDRLFVELRSLLVDIFVFVFVESVSHEFHLDLHIRCDGDVGILRQWEIRCLVLLTL